MVENWHTKALTLGYSSEFDMFNDLYNVRRLSITEIAQRFEVSTTCINYHLIDCGIDRRTRGGNHQESEKMGILFHIDQRVFDQLESKAIAKETGVSYDVVRKYKMKKHEGGMHGVLYYLTHTGFTSIREFEPDTLSATSSSGT